MAGAVGYAAAGPGGGLLASAVAFSHLVRIRPARRFDRLRDDRRVRVFVDGAEPAAVGVILGSAVPLTRALGRPWQYAVLAGAAVLILVLRRGPVRTLLAAAAAGVMLVLTGGALHNDPGVRNVFDVQRDLSSRT
ncbi:chromate transporter [Actinoplanes sp. NPDC051513]|uniref:chromate transporter n=1 Tax=Actinoplanes sp. NPDC051513 TaxID=3363908 RepID=UPI0037A59C11